MKRVKMLEDHEGCKAGDVVGFQSDDEADALIKVGKAEAFDAEKHGPGDDNGKHANSHGEAETITAADVGTLKL